MTLVAGIDPGTGGAVAVYDTETKRLVSVEDLPFWYQTVGQKKRKRLDPVGLLTLFEILCFMGVDLVVLEAVGGRPRQSASAAFVFGYAVGLIYMACMFNKLMVETVPPSRWKKLMAVPGKRGDTEVKKRLTKMKDGKAKNKATRVAVKQAEGDIMNRVQQLFPLDQDFFRTPRGAYRMDRADAGLLAKFGGDFVLPTMQPVRGDQELSLVYRNAETGA